MRRRSLTLVLWQALRRSPGALLRIGVWSVLETLPAFVIGLAIAHAISDGFAVHRPWTGLVWLAVLGGSWLVAGVGARQVILAVATVVEPFRDELLTHVVHHALSTERPDETAAARANLQVELARDAFAAVITVVRSFAFTVVSVVLGLLTLAPGLLVLVVPPFLAGLALFLCSLPALARCQRAFLVADERTVSSVTTLARGLRDITACGAEERVAAETGRRVTEQAGAGRALARVTALRTVSLALGGWLPILAVLAGTPWLMRNGAGAGAIVGALAYISQSLTPALGGLVQGLGVSGVRLAVAMDRILAPLPVVPDTRKQLVAGSVGVELNGVTFAYGPYAEPVIAGLDLRVPEGDHLAVVGPSGIGKSTLAGLITGLLAPGAGEVLTGGIPAGRLDPAARTLIPQEAYVFRGTLRDNLRYLAPAASPETIAEVIDILGMKDLVKRLGGLQAELDPGALSAGERQLIALARAYLAPAGLTILDEATCHLDPAAEARAEEAFARRGGTLIVIAHRISSARRARRVLLMDGARVRLGTHEELLTTAPLYAELVGHWQPPSREFV
ncbi:MAG: ABC transporter ATP-binding protein [Streptosporangiaceae bacterium]